jgi:hypothetical protein
MIAYKFLNPSGIGPYSGFPWPLPTSELPGAWVEARGPLELCRNGVHACRVSQLPYWWEAGLWEVELAEPITDADRMVLAPRGRLLRHMSAWHEPMMRRYARACAWRVRDYGVGRVHALGLNAAADTLAECAGLDALAATATTLVDAVPEEVAIVVGYVADAASFSIGSMALVKAVPYVAAHAAGFTAGREGGLEYEKRYRAEREWQSKWLTEHLGLPTS